MRDRRFGSWQWHGYLLAQASRASLGTGRKAFVVENVGGAGGVVGWGNAAGRPDGYTLTDARHGLRDNGRVAEIAAVRSVARLHADHATIAPNVLVVIPSLRVNTLQEFIALARANPGKYNFGSSGVGGSQHLYAELFKTAAKLDMVHSVQGGADMRRVRLLATSRWSSLRSRLCCRYQNGQLRPLAVRPRQAARQIAAGRADDRRSGIARTGDLLPGKDWQVPPECSRCRQESAPKSAAPRESRDQAMVASRTRIVGARRTNLRR